VNIQTEKAEALLNSFKDVSILVIGDIILDHFIWGKVERISPEAPVPVVEVTSESMHLGGATNVVNNIHSLGGRVYLCGIIGRDEAGAKIIEELKGKKIPTDGIVFDDKMPSTIKTRIIAHSQQVVRFDKEKKDEIGAAAFQAILGYANSMVNEVEALIISDYAKGVVTKELVKELVSLYRGAGKVVAVDPKVKHIDYYKGATIITPNTFEASKASGIDIEDDESLVRAGNYLLDSFKCDALLITRGEQGMALFERSGGYTAIPAVAHEVYDVTGAGDTVIGVLALAIAAGASFIEAAIISNHAAGIVVGEVGTATVTLKTLQDALINRLNLKGGR
jgi:rfaE bifunctional protein kinase chain/domain